MGIDDVQVSDGAYKKHNRISRPHHFFETHRKYCNTTMLCPKCCKNGGTLRQKFQFLICTLNAVFASAKNVLAGSLKHKGFETWLLKLGT